MNIKLYNIPGISRIDTPSFSDDRDQAYFFDHNVVATVTSTFYPPHYENKIKFDTDDIELTDTVNYLSFYVFGKEYYYFIDKIEYINENCIELSITMDVIQTFMFNIDIINGIIERKFINRFVSYNVGASRHWRINRNYIRENVSSGLFDYGVKEYFDMSFSVLVVKCTRNIDYGSTQTDKWISSDGMISDTYTIREKFFKVNDLLSSRQSFNNCIFYFLPLLDKRILRLELGDYSMNYDYSSLNISNILSNPNVVDAFLLPIEMFNNMFTYEPYTLDNIHGYKIVINDNMILHQFCLESSNISPLLELYNYLEPVYYTINNRYVNAYLINDFSLTSRRLEILFDFSKNTLLSQTFSTDFIPQLYDENYIHLMYGTPSSNQYYPLYTITNTTLYMFEYPSIFSYDISYFISYYYYPRGSEIAELYLNNRYDEFLLYNSPNLVTFTNDPYKEYVAANRGRWASAIGSTVVSAADLLVGVKIAGMSRTTALDSIIYNPKKRTPKKNLLNYSAIRNIREVENTYREDLLSEVPTGVRGATNILDQGVQDLNAALRPKSVKQVGNSEGMILSLDTIPFYQISHCIDYDKCGMYFHRNGYRVDEYISSVNAIFTYVNTRYYFNILKMSNVELRLSDYVNSEDILDEIKDRLITGLRLWNVMSQGVTLGDFTYDNVEKEFLS